MLEVTIPPIQLYDENTNEFGETKSYSLTLEHSLISISKWESKWKKPFLSEEKKTPEELIDYIKCMSVTSNIPDVIYNNLPKTVLDAIAAYIDDSMTATWFNDTSPKKSKKVVTSELIYYWMVASNIPFECQKWHLNRLLTLIRICGLENSTKQKMPKSEILSRNKALNAARRKAGNHKG